MCFKINFNENNSVHMQLTSHILTCTSESSSSSEEDVGDEVAEVVASSSDEESESSDDSRIEYGFSSLSSTDVVVAGVDKKLLWCFFSDRDRIDCNEKYDDMFATH